jgi:hypothetical protein
MTFDHSQSRERVVNDNYQEVVETIVR